METRVLGTPAQRSVSPNLPAHTASPTETRIDIESGLPTLAQQPMSPGEVRRAGTVWGYVGRAAAAVAALGTTALALTSLFGRGSASPSTTLVPQSPATGLVPSSGADPVVSRGLSAASVTPVQVSQSTTGMSMRGTVEKMANDLALLTPPPMPPAVSSPTARRPLAVPVASPDALGTTTSPYRLGVAVSSNATGAFFSTAGGYRLTQLPPSGAPVTTDISTSAPFAILVPNGPSQDVILLGPTTASLNPVNAATGAAGSPIALGSWGEAIKVLPQADGSRVVITLSPSGDTYKFEAFTVSADGAAISARQDVSPAQPQRMVAGKALSNGNNLLVYQVGSNTYGRLISASGAPVGNPFVMTGTSDYYPPQFSFLDTGEGKVRAVWASGNKLYTQEFNTTSGSSIGSPVQIATASGSSTYAGLALSRGANGQFIVTRINKVAGTAEVTVLNAAGAVVFEKSNAISNTGTATTFSTSAAQTDSGVVMAVANANAQSILLTYSGTGTQLGAAQTLAGPSAIGQVSGEDVRVVTAAPSGAVTGQVYTGPTLTTTMPLNGALPPYSFNGPAFSVGAIDVDSNVVTPVTVQVPTNFTGSVQFANGNANGVTITGSGSNYQLTGSAAGIKAYLANPQFMQLTPAVDSSAPGSVTLTATADGLQKTWTRTISAANGPLLTTTTPTAASVAVGYNGGSVPVGGFNVTSNAATLIAALDLGSWPGAFTPGAAVGAMTITPPVSGSTVWTFSGPRTDVATYLLNGVGNITPPTDTAVPTSVMTLTVSGAGLTQSFTRTVSASSTPTFTIAPNTPQSLIYSYVAGSVAPVQAPALTMSTNSLQGSISVNMTGLTGVATYNVPGTLPDGTTLAAAGITVQSVNGITTFSGPTSALAALAQNLGTFQPLPGATGSGSAIITLTAGPSSVAVPFNIGLSGALQLTNNAAQTTTFPFTGGVGSLPGFTFVGGSGVNTTATFNSSGLTAAGMTWTPPMVPVASGISTSVNGTTVTYTGPTAAMRTFLGQSSAVTTTSGETDTATLQCTITSGSDSITATRTLVLSGDLQTNSPLTTTLNSALATPATVAPMQVVSGSPRLSVRVDKSQFRGTFTPTTVSGVTLTTSGQYLIASGNTADVQAWLLNAGTMVSSDSTISSPLTFVVTNDPPNAQSLTFTQTFAPQVASTITPLTPSVPGMVQTILGLGGSPSIVSQSRNGDIVEEVLRDDRGIYFATFNATTGAGHVYHSVPADTPSVSGMRAAAVDGKLVTAFQSPDGLTTQLRAQVLSRNATMPSASAPTVLGTLPISTTYRDMISPTGSNSYVNFIQGSGAPSAVYATAFHVNGAQVVVDSPPAQVASGVGESLKTVSLLNSARTPIGNAIFYRKGDGKTYCRRFQSGTWSAEVEVKSGGSSWGSNTPNANMQTYALPNGNVVLVAGYRNTQSVGASEGIRIAEVNPATGTVVRSASLLSPAGDQSIGHLSVTGDGQGSMYITGQDRGNNQLHVWKFSDASPTTVVGHRVATAPVFHDYPTSFNVVPPSAATEKTLVFFNTGTGVVLLQQFGEMGPGTDGAEASPILNLTPGATGIGPFAVVGQTDAATTTLGPVSRAVGLDGETLVWMTELQGTEILPRNRIGTPASGSALEDATSVSLPTLNTIAGAPVRVLGPSGTTNAVTLSLTMSNAQTYTGLPSDGVINIPTGVSGVTFSRSADGKTLTATGTRDAVLAWANTPNYCSFRPDSNYHGNITVTAQLETAWDSAEYSGRVAVASVTDPVSYSGSALGSQTIAYGQKPSDVDLDGQFTDPDLITDGGRLGFGVVPLGALPGLPGVTASFNTATGVLSYTGAVTGAGSQPQTIVITAQYFAPNGTTPLATFNRNFTLTGTSATGSTTAGVDVGTIVGATAGGVAAVVITIIVGCCIRACVRRKAQAATRAEEEAGAARTDGETSSDADADALPLSNLARVPAAPPPVAGLAVTTAAPVPPPPPPPPTAALPRSEWRSPSTRTPDGDERRMSATSY